MKVEYYYLAGFSSSTLLTVVPTYYTVLQISKSCSPEAAEAFRFIEPRYAFDMLYKYKGFKCID
jgi:hypothetical protein